MIKFKGILRKFESKGEKTGWTFISLNKTNANKLNQGVKKTYRVKGFIDFVAINAKAIMPMGDGSFIMPIKADLRKQLNKKEGDKVEVALEIDGNVDLSSSDLLICLKDDIVAERFFFSLTLSHQNYFSNYINSAKTIITKEKRIVECIEALAKGKKFDEMLRERKQKNAY